MSVQERKKHMSDPVTSGEPFAASAATAGPASTAASAGNSAPIGSFGTAKGSGLLRGKRPTPPAASAASSPAASGYQPSTIEVIRPQSEYKNPFTGETSVPSPVVNEPSAAPLSGTAESRPIATPSPADVTEAPPPAVSSAIAQRATAEGSAKEAASMPAKKNPPSEDAAVAGELFPLELSGGARKSVEPTTKAELNILPTEEVKRPAVSWGEHAHSQNGEPRGRRDERPTFRPERRDARPFEPREPRREPVTGERNSFPRDQQRDPRDQPRDFSRDERPAPVAAPQKKSGGFFGWLKSLFAEKPSQPEVRTGDRDDQGRDGQGRDGQGRHNRRRHRGGRGRGGFQGDNRGPREQPRDPRDEPGPSSDDGGQSGEQRFEGGGGGRRRHRGGRGRNRDDRGGPRPEGQQGGGAI